MRTIIKIIISAFAVIITSYLLRGVHVESFFTALVVAAVLAILNAFLRPLLIIFTIQITVYTFGLFLLVINSALIMFTSHIVKGFDVDNFWWALAFSIIVSVITSVLDSFNRKDEK